MPNTHCNLRYSTILSTAYATILVLIPLWSNAQTTTDDQVLSSQTLNSTEKKREDQRRKAEALEEVTVTGIRTQLESALEFKRNAASIVDHISADDIGSFPALDLGETLQAIPGVQVNREAERRSSSISLRGLPGGFTRSTVNGHDFANPTRSFSPTSQSPFGAFESGVFRGITVIKTPTADLMEGGIAGIVDKKLPNALAGKNEFRFNLGARIEPLNDTTDPEFSLSGRFKFTEDFAIAGSFAGSAQRFRRDSLIVNDYVFFDEKRFPGLPAFKAKYGIPEDEDILYPGEFRQLSEINDGKRWSLSTNIAWQANDELKLSADILATQRDLDDNRFESYSLQADQRHGRYLVEPDETRAQPFVAGYNDEGERVWGQSAFTFENAAYSNGNRIFNFLEQTAGMFLNADWESGNWVIDTTLGYSEASNVFVQTPFNIVIRQDRFDRGRSNGLTGHVYTGEDNYKNLSIGFDNWGFNPNSEQVYDRLDLDQEFRFLGRGLWDTGSSNLQAVADPGFRNLLRISTGGNVQNSDRNLTTFDINFAHEFSEGFVNRLKFGYKYARENVDHTRFDGGAAGVNLDAISNDIITEPVYKNSTPFFNDTLGDFLSYEKGWWSIDIESFEKPFIEGNKARVLAGLQQALANGELGRIEYEKRVNEVQVIPESGLLRRPGRNIDWVFDVNLDSTALFAMTDFSTELANVYFSGNFGVRYVSTELLGTGNSEQFRIVQDNPSNPGPDDDPIDAGEDNINFPSAVKNKYHHFLPMFNIAADLTDDVKMRFAAYRGMVRPNLRVSRPALSVTINDGLDRINVDLPESDLEPYTANSFDFSTAWYNRKGSAIILGIFRKDLQGSFDKETFCPANGRAFGIDSTLSINALGDCIVDDPARILASRQAATDGNPLPVELGSNDIDIAAGEEMEIRITKTINSPDVIQIKGAEISLQQNLDFLPAPWNGLGGVFNYSKVRLNGDEELRGVSENSYNLIGYFENDIFGVRLSYNYRDAYTLKGSGNFQGADVREVSPRGQLDVSLTVTPVDNLKLSLRGFNVTNEITEEYLLSNRRMPARINYDGRIYSLSASYKF